jgi:hypothetical protein
VFFRFRQPLGRRGNTRRRWRFVVSACKLFPGKLQNLSSTSRVSTRALTIVRLKQEIKRDVVLSYRLVCVIDGVLVVTTQFAAGYRASQGVRSRFGRRFLARADHGWWRLNFTLL